MAGYVCPRCGTEMEYRVEVELGNGTRRITYYYRCPRCGYRLLDLVLSVTRKNGGIKLEAYDYIAVRRR